MERALQGLQVKVSSYAGVSCRRSELGLGVSSVVGSGAACSRSRFESKDPLVDVSDAVWLWSAEVTKVELYRSVREGSIVEERRGR